MELAIKEQKRNPFLLRDEIRAVSSNGITPTIEGVKMELAEKLGKDKDLVVIRQIKGKFGRKNFEITAYIYDNKDLMGKIEQKPKAKKEKPVEEKKAEGKEEAKNKA